MNIIDVAIITIFLLFALMGYVRGLVLMAINLVSIFVAMFLSYLLYPYMGNLLRQTPLYEWLQETITSNISFRDMVPESIGGVDYPSIIGSLPLPDSLRESLESLNTPDIYDMLRVSSVEGYVGGFIANMILQIISMALVFLLVMIAMKLLGGILDTVCKLPVLNIVNKTGGMIFGALIGLITIWAFVMVITALGPMMPQAREYMEGSAMANWFAENNLFTLIVSQVR